MKLTADNITDDQIRELRAELNHVDRVWTADEREVMDGYPFTTDPERVLRCRARCAEILNARSEGKG